MASPKKQKRTEPFNANAWRLFGIWLNYVEHGLNLAYDLATRGDQQLSARGVSDRVNGVRWYATDLALLHALVFRAAGLRDDEKVCFDQELADISAAFDAEHPKLRDLRNALFAHPPFVDELVGSDEVVFFSTGGIHIAPVAGGAVKPIIDPFLAHAELPATIDRLRTLFAARMESREDI